MTAETQAQPSTPSTQTQSASAPATPPRDLWQLDLAIIVLPAFAVFIYTVIDRNMFADGDTNWHVATGQWILAHHSVPITDPFSFTAFGHRWVTHEWLSEVVMALSYGAAGWSGVMLLVGACAAGAAALLASELRRHLGALSAFAALAFAFSVLMPHFLARPHLITLPLLVFWTARLMRARREQRLPPLWMLPLMTLWANMHGSFIFGLAFAGLFGLEAVLAEIGADEGGTLLKPIGKPISTAAKWGAFLIALTGMACITPNGVTGLTYPVYVMSMKNLGSIGEWKPAHFGKISSLELALFFTLAVCLYRGVRVGAARLGLLLLLFFMTLQHIRQEVVLAVMAPLLLAEPMGRVFEPARAGESNQGPDRSVAWPPLAEIGPPAAVLALFFLATAAWRVATPTTRKDSAGVPVTALAHVPAALRTERVFNDYSFGGWLIFNHIPVFMDGRSDMYGDTLLSLYLAVDAGDRASIDKAFRKYGVKWSIMTPSSGLVKVLDATPGWRRIWTDKTAVVQAREGGPGAPTVPSTSPAPRQPHPPPPRPHSAVR